MKSILYKSLLAATFLLCAIEGFAQNSTDGKVQNYVVLTKKVPQLQPIILTAAALRAEDGVLFGDFQVIICGKDIADITDSEKIDEFITKAEKAGVKIVACGFSLRKFQVERSEVPKPIKIVENGILHNFQLQKKGYKSISL